MENKFESKEENDPMSRLIGVVREVGGKLCGIADERLKGVENHFNSSVDKFLEETKKHIKALLDNLEKIIKQNLDGVEATANEAIIQCLVDIGKSVDELCKEVGKKVQNKLDEVSIKDLVDNINRLAETLEDRVARLKPGERMGLMGASFTDKRLPNAPRENGSLPQGEQASSNKEPDTQRVDWSEGVKEIGQLKKKIKAL
ncbi:MAG: hypothetical protein ACEY3A_03090 [Wolbachia sp.]